MKYFLGITVLLVMLFGCTLRHVPQPPALVSTRVPVIQLSEPVHWVNAQKTKEEIKLPVSPYTLIVNLQEYTETVIAALKTEFDRKGYLFSDAARKKIKIAVVDVSLVHFAGGINCNFDLTVQPGDRPGFGIQSSAQSWDFQKAINYAAADAVSRILNHSEVIGYLEGM